MAGDDGSGRLLVGDVIDRLGTLPDGCARCCVTSPPYWGLRDYGVEGQIGLEPTPEAYVARMVDVFRAVRRVLADDGTLWLNLGDSYAGSWGAQSRGDFTPGTLEGAASREVCLSARQIKAHPKGQNGTGSLKRTPGLKNKDLIGIPWRVSLALQADGWYLRSDIIWAKPNPMPESVTDRPTKAHEYVFLLSKAERYYYDADAIREAHRGRPSGNVERRFEQNINGEAGIGHCVPWQPGEDGRNARTVWTIATQPYPEAHFATFPRALPERCIKAGSAEGDTVLDPFLGSGTTAEAAVLLGRKWIGCELNPAYAELARKRIGKAEKGACWRDDTADEPAPLFESVLPPRPPRLRVQT